MPSVNWKSVKERLKNMEHKKNNSDAFKKDGEEVMEGLSRGLKKDFDGYNAVWNSKSYVEQTNDDLPTVEQLKEDVQITTAYVSARGADFVGLDFVLGYKTSPFGFINFYGYGGTILGLMQQAVDEALKEHAEMYYPCVRCYIDDSITKVREWRDGATGDHIFNLSGRAVVESEPEPKKQKTKNGKEYCEWHFGHSYDDDYGNCVCCGGPRE